MNEQGSPQQLDLQARALLNALYGLSYLVDPDGYLLDYNQQAWNQFALTNGAPELADKSNVTGKSLYDFIAGEETKQSYRNFAELLIKGRRDSVAFPYRCDAPEIRRDLHMAITPIKQGHQVVALLYHSISLEEHHRPAMNIFRQLPQTAEVKQLPLLGACSYCKNVRFPAGSKEGEWVTAEKYYQLGGSEAVWLSHTICPYCYENIVQPLLATYKN